MTHAEPPLSAPLASWDTEQAELSGEEVQVACDADTDMATVVEVLLARHSELGASLVLTAADIDAPEPIPQMRGE